MSAVSIYSIQILGASGENPPSVWRKKCAQEMLQKNSLRYDFTWLYQCSLAIGIPASPTSWAIRKSGATAPKPARNED